VRGGWGGGKHWLGVLWRGPGALGNDLDERRGTDFLPFALCPQWELHRLEPTVYLWNGSQSIARSVVRKCI